MDQPEVLTNNAVELRIRCGTSLVRFYQKTQGGAISVATRGACPLNVKTMEVITDWLEKAMIPE